jgi:hypothetical protein|tara:strand:- start:1832 stop:2107 length:276 start_codon:yes stop_codon:yes gene_type:complete
MKYSFIYEYEEYVFEVFYIYEKATFTGDWMQPPDPDKIEYYEIRLLSYTTEDGKELFCKQNPDVQHILSGVIIQSIEDAMMEDVEKNEYHL